MATVKLTPNYAILNDGIALASVVSQGEEDGVAVALSAQDTKTAILLQNAGGSTASAYISSEGGTVEGFTVSVGAGETRVVVVDSGFYKHLKGELKGHVHISVDPTVKVSAVVLP